MRFFTPKGVESELRYAAREFFQRDGMEVDLAKRTIYLTRIMKWWVLDQMIGLFSIKNAFAYKKMAVQLQPSKSNLANFTFLTFLCVFLDMPRIFLSLLYAHTISLFVAWNTRLDSIHSKLPTSYSSSLFYWIRSLYIHTCAFIYKVICIPFCFCRFNMDFGQDKVMLKWILNYLDATKAGLLTHLLGDAGPVNISYLNYDWSVNS